jgi:hypothetical protein
MKKVLVFLMILAVAAGAFADGWWVGANAKVETSANFDGTPAIVLNWGETFGNVDLGYSTVKEHGTFSGSIGFNQKDGIGLGANGSGNDGRYYFKMGGNISANGAMYTNSDPTATQAYDYNGNLGITRGDLWGWYRLLKGGPLEIHLEIDVQGGSWDWWDWRWGSTSFDHMGIGIGPFAAFWSGGTWSAFRANGAGGWNDYDGTLGADFIMDKISFGIILPDVFSGNSTALQDSFLNGIFGAKFSDPLFNFAVNFGLSDYRVYFGFGTKIADTVDVGLAFSGFVDGPDYNAAAGIKAGAGFGDFGFNVDVLAKIMPSFQFGMFPSFWYKVMPDNLWFGVNAGFLFGFDPNSVDWEMGTTIAWNFNNNGAGDDPGTGMILKYNIDSSAPTNKLTLIFKWNI